MPRAVNFSTTLEALTEHLVLHLWSKRYKELVAFEITIYLLKHMIISCSLPVLSNYSVGAQLSIVIFLTNQLYNTPSYLQNLHIILTLCQVAFCPSAHLVIIVIYHPIITASFTRSITSALCMTWGLLRYKAIQLDPLNNLTVFV